MYNASKIDFKISVVYFMFHCIMYITHVSWCLLSEFRWRPSVWLPESIYRITMSPWSPLDFIRLAPISSDSGSALRFVPDFMISTSSTTIRSSSAVKISKQAFRKWLLIPILLFTAANKKMLHHMQFICTRKESVKLYVRYLYWPYLTENFFIYTLFLFIIAYVILLIIYMYLILHRLSLPKAFIRTHCKMVYIYAIMMFSSVNKTKCTIYHWFWFDIPSSWFEGPPFWLAGCSSRGLAWSSDKSPTTSNSLSSSSLSLYSISNISLIMQCIANICFLALCEKITLGNLSQVRIQSVVDFFVLFHSLFFFNF